MACERSTWLYDFHKNAIVTVTWKIIAALWLMSTVIGAGKREWKGYSMWDFNLENNTKIIKIILKNIWKTRLIKERGGKKKLKIRDVGMCHVGASISGQNVETTTEIWCWDVVEWRIWPENVRDFREGLFGVKKIKFNIWLNFVFKG